MHAQGVMLDARNMDVETYAADKLNEEVTKIAMAASVGERVFAAME